MKVRTTWRFLPFFLLMALLVTPPNTYSCGPFFEQTIFSYSESPNVPLEKFYDGQMGVLRPTYDRNYLVIAYRHLMELDKVKTYRKGQTDQSNDANPVENSGAPTDQSPAVKIWVKARTRVPDVPRPASYDQSAPVSQDQPYQQFLNCPDNAFVMAARTLDDRIAKYGADSSDIKDWVAGQDAVFANCSTAGPVVLPTALAVGPAWLKQDRTYQTAAANFYARNFDDAMKLFDAIAADHSSPWSWIASYLAARTMIRKATLEAGKDQPFDKAVMADAEVRLQKILQDPSQSKIHDDARRMLAFVRFRIHPAERAAELETELLRKSPDENFDQNLTDYLALNYQGEGAGDLSDWLKTFHLSYSSYDEKHAQPDSSAAPHALQQWKQKSTLPWLVAALNLASATDPAVPKLLAAAEKVPTRSPGYLTVRYYALRLMISTGRKTEARRELDGILVQSALPAGTRNLFIEERLPLATSFDDFLKNAPERPAAIGVDENGGDNVPPSQPGPKPQPVFLDTYAAKVFAKRLPLDLFSQAASSASLPQSLQRDVALAAWTRAILLDDIPTAARLVPPLEKLEPSLQAGLQEFQAASSDAEKNFAAIFLILKNPGLKPYIMRGEGRTEFMAGEEPLKKIDDLRDNWWCASMGADPASINYYDYERSEYDEKQPEPSAKFRDSDTAFPYPDFLSESQRIAAGQQWDQLTKLGTAPNWLAQQTVEWAKAHPADPRIPEALYLAVRATRYGCTNKLTTKYSKSAFDLLHEKYPQSEWAKKTKYYF